MQSSLCDWWWTMIMSISRKQQHIHPTSNHSMRLWENNTFSVEERLEPLLSFIRTPHTLAQRGKDKEGTVMAWARDPGLQTSFMKLELTVSLYHRLEMVFPIFSTVELLVDVSSVSVDMYLSFQPKCALLRCLPVTPPYRQPSAVEHFRAVFIIKVRTWHY